MHNLAPQPFISVSWVLHFNTAFLIGMELRSVHLSERLSSLPVNKESTSEHNIGSSPRGPCCHLALQFSEVCRGCGNFGVLVFPVCVEGLRDQQYGPFSSCGFGMDCDVEAEIHKDLLFWTQAHKITPISVHGEVDFVRFPFIVGFCLIDWLVFLPFLASFSIFYDCPKKEADHDGGLPDEATSPLGNGLRPSIIVQE